MFIPGFFGDICETGLFLELPDRLLPVVRHGCPAFPIHPNPIHIIDARQFPQLRDEQLVGIGAEPARGVGIDLPIRIQHRPGRVLCDGLRIPHPGIVHVKGHAVPCGHIPPHPQWIPHEPRGRVSHPGRVAAETGMTLAIDLQVVRVHLIDHALDHFGGRVLPDLGAILPGVKIKVDPQKAVGPARALRVGSGFRRLGDEPGSQQ